MPDVKPGLGASGTSLISVAAAVLLAAAYGVYPSLRSTRPEVPATVIEAGGVQQVDARLWEDPFYATAQFLDVASRPGQPAPTVQHACTPEVAVASSAPPEATQTQPIFAIVPGGPYEQAAEARRRTRFAVLAALHVAGYEAMDPEHLGCLRYSATAANTKAGQPVPIDQPTEFIIPYERFDASYSADNTVDSTAYRLGNKRIILVWIDENLLRDSGTPYQTLFVIKQTLHWPAADAAIRVIGPYSSMQLKRFVAAPCDSLYPPVSFAFFNYGATIAPASLKDDVTDPGGTAHYTAKSCGAAHYFNVVSTDDRLAELLRAELGVRLAADARIALVHEFDTVYGRELAGTIAKTLDADCVLNKPWCRVSQLGYLRGLDGSLPSVPARAAEPATQAAAQAGADTAPRGPTMWPLPARYDPAEGNAQLDYLDRITWQLQRMEQVTRHSFGAIGLLGADVYDKLLLLRALRPSFPRAVFFTTDLDARLFDPAEFATTRGMIVASSFSLRARPDPVQASAPFFRDTYQTAAFLAAQGAIRDAWPKDPALADKPAGWPAAPLLYMICKWGPLPLPVNVAHTVPGWPSPVGGTHGAAQPGSVLTQWQFVLCGLIFAVWLVLVYEFRLLRYRAAAISLLLLALSAAVLNTTSGVRSGLSGANGTGEPFYFTSGVSLWPVVELRVIGALFCFGAIVFVLRCVRGNGADVAKVFGLITPARSTWDTLDRALRDIFFGMATGWRGTDADRPDGTSPSIYDSRVERYTSVQDMWTRLCPPSTLPRLLRAGIYAIVTFLLLGLSAALCDAPYIPHRGGLVLPAYVAATAANVALMHFLIMLVFDATMFSRYFTSLLRRIRDDADNSRDMAWPPETETAFFVKFGLSPKPLLRDRIDVEMVAMRSACIIELIYYPVIALCICTLSMSTVFDDVPLYPPLLALAAGGLGLLIAIALYIRGEAEKVRAGAMQRLEAAILANRGRAPEHDHLEACLKNLRNFRGGAFMSFSQQPVWRAILLLLSSLGGSALLEQLPGSIAPP